MAFTPTRISELTLMSPQLTDQVPIARGSGTSGRTYRVYIRDLIGNVWNVVDTPTVNMSFDSSTLTLSAEVIDNSISNLKIRDSSSLSVIGRSANSFGNPADIAATTNGQVLRVNTAGTVLGFGPVDLANPNAVTNVLPISAGGSGSTDRRNLVPVGAIMPMATPTAPVGWLYCDGSTIPAVGGTFQGRPVADLQELRTLLAFTYDPITMSSFGKLPDLRGMFVRGWDDGRGKDIGRTFASDQLDAFQGHKHGIYDPQHKHQIIDPGHAHQIRASGSFSVEAIPGPGAPIGRTLTGGGYEGAEVVIDVTSGGSVTKRIGTIVTDYLKFNGVSIGNEFVESATVNVAMIASTTAATFNSLTAVTGITQTELSATDVLVQNPTADSVDVGSAVGNSGGTAPRTADETRPENVALYYCIKY